MCDDRYAPLCFTKAHNLKGWLGSPRGCPQLCNCLYFSGKTEPDTQGPAAGSIWNANRQEHCLLNQLAEESRQGGWWLVAVRRPQALCCTCTGWGEMSYLLHPAVLCWAAWVGRTLPRAGRSKRMSLPSHLHIGKVHAVEVTQHLVNL